MLESSTCYQAVGVFGLYEEQELSGGTYRSCQGSPYYAPTDASSASCYGDISESVNSSDQTPPYAATDEGSQASVDGSVVVGKGSAETEAGSDGVQHNKQPDDKTPKDGSKTTSEGLSPITAAESSDSGAVSDCRRTTINGREVSINHFDIPAVGGEPVARYSESAHRHHNSKRAPSLFTEGEMLLNLGTAPQTYIDSQHFSQVRRQTCSRLLRSQKPGADDALPRTGSRHVPAW